MSDVIRTALGPGVYDDLTPQQYHADPCAKPALCSSLAKLILNRTPLHCWMAHPRLNPDYKRHEDKKFSAGKVVHELLLGKGGGFDVLDYPDWRKDAAEAARDKSWRAGRTPILEHHYDDCRDMAKTVCKRLYAVPACRALASDPRVGSLQGGVGERVFVWSEGEALCRAMVDYVGPGPLDVWDVKTTGNGLSDDAIARTIFALDYDLSAAFYLRGLEARYPEHAGRFRWRWIFVEDSKPFEVRVVEPSGEVLAIGARKAALAIYKWRRAMEHDEWPGYPPTVERVGLPGWAEARWLERETADPDAAGALGDYFATPQGGNSKELVQ